MSVIRKVTPFLLRGSRGFAAYLGPLAGPCSLGFRRMAWCAAEPDYPPSTLLRSGSPARQLVLGWLSDSTGTRGRAEAGWHGLEAVVGVDRVAAEDGR
jgi:hypothetical protein